MGSLRTRKATARALASLVVPIIDDYLRVARRLTIYSNHSPDQFAAEVAPRFVELALIFDEPRLPDLSDLILAEVRHYLVGRWMEYQAKLQSKIEENRNMSRPKGTPKTGGRKKGTRNLRTLVLRESLDRVGFDIVQELYELYPKLEPETQAKILMSFLPFLFPKPMPVPASDLRTYEMYKKADTSIFGNLDGGPDVEVELDDSED
ncbi:MAG TPA: hypothetical protein VGE46_00330 [Bdellovibrio sp.]